MTTTERHDELIDSLRELRAKLDVLLTDQNVLLGRANMLREYEILRDEDRAFGLGPRRKLRLEEVRKRLWGGE